MCSHMQEHGCNPEIDEGGGGGGGGGVHNTYISRGSGGVLHKYFEIFMSRESFWCNLGLDARLETIKWHFLD